MPFQKGHKLAQRSESDRQLFTSTDYSVTNKITYQGDWNGIEMSGISLAEIGIAGSFAASTGSIWTRTSFTPINFNGSNELQIEETWEVY